MLVQSVEHTEFVRRIKGLAAGDEANPIPRSEAAAKIFFTSNYEPRRG